MRSEGVMGVQLYHPIEADIDNILLESSEDDMNFSEEQAQQLLPENLIKETLETLRQNFYGYRY